MSSSSVCGSAGASASEFGPFTCSACTFFNESPSATRCAVCSTYRTPSLAAAAAEMSSEKSRESLASSASSAGSSRWVCQSCTYLNRKTRDTCSMCTVGTRAESEAVTRGSREGEESDTSASDFCHHRSKRRKGAAATTISSDEDTSSIARASPLATTTADAALDPPSVAAPKKSRRVVCPKRTSSKVAADPVPSHLSFVMGALSAGIAAGMAGMPFGGLSLGTVMPFGTPSSSTAAATAAASSKPAPIKPPSMTNEDSRPELTDAEISLYHEHFSTAVSLHKKLRGPSPAEASEADRQAAQHILSHLYEAIQFQPPAPSSASTPADESSSSCPVCLCEFDEDCEAGRLQNCGHAALCTDCLHNYVRIKVTDEAVMPWIVCPTPKCCQPISADDLAGVAGLTTPEMAHLAVSYMRRRLVRNECFVSCQTRNCAFGFIVQNTKSGKVRGGTCDAMRCAADRVATSSDSSLLLSHICPCSSLCPALLLAASEGVQEDVPPLRLLSVGGARKGGRTGSRVPADDHRGHAPAVSQVQAPHAQRER